MNHISPEEKSPSEPEKNDVFVKRVFITVGIVITCGLVLYIFCNAVDVFLLFFAGALFAIFLRGLGKLISHHTGIPPNIASIGVVLLLFVLLSLSFWIAAPTISVQIDQLFEKLPSTVEAAKNYLMQFGLVRSFLNSPNFENLMPNQMFFIGKSAPVATSMLGGLVSFFLILLIGVYLAVQSQTYVRGFLQLFPAQHQNRVDLILAEIENKLRWWIVGQCISMFIIGILTTIGLIALGIPLAFLLGLMAALLTFIPNIGPILAAIPAILFGFVQSPQTALYVLLLYIGVQTIETYFVTPFVQNRTIALPPVLIIFSQILLGILLGFAGLALATPLLAMIMVLVQEIYLKNKPQLLEVQNVTPPETETSIQDDDEVT